MISVPAPTPVDDAILSVDGNSLLGLAQALESRLTFLTNAHQKERVRKDPRLSKFNIGIHFDTKAVLDSNYNSIAFLANEALKRGEESPEAYLLLAKALYELDLLEDALKVVSLAQDKDLHSPQLMNLNKSILLEKGDSHSLESYANLKGISPSELFTLDVVDYPDFAQWASLAEAEMVNTRTHSQQAEGTMLCCLDGEIHEFTNSISPSEPVGALIRDLKVRGENIPYANGKAYYDAGLIRASCHSINACEASRSRIAVTEAGAETHLNGKFIVPNASSSYYTNYFHSICQIYSRIVQALSTERFHEYKVLLPESVPSWGLSILDRCGIGQDRIHTVSKYEAVTVEEALVLPMKWDICPSEITAMRNALGVPKYSNSERINYYMVPKNAQNNTRTLVNEDEFIEICKSRGFRIIDPLEYSIEEQINIFQNAGIIATSASSAYTNMLYAISGADIILTVPKLFWGMLSTDLATSCGHSISHVFAEYIAGSTVFTPHNPYVADASMFERLLDDKLLPQKPT